MGFRFTRHSLGTKEGNVFKSPIAGHPLLPGRAKLGHGNRKMEEGRPS